MAPWSYSRTAVTITVPSHHDVSPAKKRCGNTFFHSYSGQEELVISRVESAQVGRYMRNSHVSGLAQSAIAQTSQVGGGPKVRASRGYDRVGSGRETFKLFKARAGSGLKRAFSRIGSYHDFRGTRCSLVGSY